MIARVPRATIARLPRYLRYLDGLPGRRETVSSDDIAAGTGVSAAQVRRDLSHLGSVGTRGLGYHVVGLRELIARALGLDGELAVAIIGAGNLGTALANYKGFARLGFRIVAVYDVSPDRVGTMAGEHRVRHLDELTVGDSRARPTIGIIATPAEAAQAVADRLVSVGIRSILNFAPTTIMVPDDVAIRQVDLAVELQILSYHLATVRPQAVR